MNNRFRCKATLAVKYCRQTRTHTRTHRYAAIKPVKRTVKCSTVVAKFHYTGPTGPARTRTDFMRPGSPRNSVGSVRVSDKVRAGPRGSGRVRVEEFSLYRTRGSATAHNVRVRVRVWIRPGMTVSDVAQHVTENVRANASQ